jgi:hypothetical protein
MNNPQVSILLWNSVQHTLFDICWSNPFMQMALAAMKKILLRAIQRAKDIVRATTFQDT